MNLKRTLVGAVAVSGLLAAALTGTAQADTNATNGAYLATGGSDTIDGLVNYLSGLSGVTLANYTAVGTATIDTTANYPAAARQVGANCAGVTRPNGSGAGKNALSAAIRGAAYGGSTNYLECLGIARSSSSGFPTLTNLVPTGTMARIPIALDAVGPAVNFGSTIGKKFTLDFLKSVYTRNGAAGSAACLGVVPLLPQGASGTRSFWASVMGVTDWDFGGTGAGAIPTTPPSSTTQTWGSCVTGGAANPMGFGTAAGNGNIADRQGGTATGTPIEEHDGRVLTGTNMVVPISIAQNIGQGSQVLTDLRGASQLATVDFTTVGDPNTPSTFAPVTANLRAPYLINGGSGASGFTGARGNLTREVFLFAPHALYDSAYTPPAGATGFANTSAADRAAFSTEFVSTATTPSTICQQTAAITLYGFSPVADCGIPTLNP